MFSLVQIHSVLAQVEIGGAGSITSLVTQFGGLGLAIWLVIHHTLVVIPGLQKEHRTERQQDLEIFRAERQQDLETFKEMLANQQCKFKN